MDKERKINNFEEKEELFLLKFEEIFKPKKKRKKREERTVKSTSAKTACPYCGKMFIGLGRHLNSCSKNYHASDFKGTVKPAQRNQVNLSSNLKEKKECPYCKEEFVSLGRHLSYCRKKYKKMFRKIYKTLLELSKNFTRIHLQELVNKTKIYNLDLTKEIVKFSINENFISAKYDDLSNGIEFFYVEKEIDEILSKFNEWGKNQNDTGKQKIHNREGPY